MSKTPENVLNLTREIKGMPVEMLPQGRHLGTSVDAIVHPTEGVLLGLAMVNGDGQERLLRANDCLVNQESSVVLVTPDAWEELPLQPESFAAGVRVCETLLDVEVITNQGRSLGRVVEVYATEVKLRTIYRVATYRWRFLVRGGFFLPGDLPIAWLERGARLIVPADAIERESFSTLPEALKLV